MGAKVARTPEGRIKKHVKELLTQYTPIYTNWPVPSGYGEPMLDCVGCYGGQFFMIETKFDDELTPRQNLTREQVVEAGGRVFVIDGTAGDPTAWEGWLELVTWLNQIRDSL